MKQVQFQTAAPPSKTFRIGSVSYLNAKPLIYGLDSRSDIELGLEVPSRLLEGLAHERYDLALLPVIDYQRLDGLRLVGSGGIGCDGPTLTVRIFSREPVENLTTLACDPDSHTSVALARVILAERYALHPRIVPLAGDAAQRCSQLLIGDKVVCREPAGMDQQLDLGLAWRELTGLPFVFAIWTARAGADLGDLPERLERCKRAGLANVQEIIARDAIPRGWPADVALKYLTEYLRYDIGPRQIEAIKLFHQLAARHGLIPSPPKEIEFYKESPKAEARR